MQLFQEEQSFRLKKKQLPIKYSLSALIRESYNYNRSWTVRRALLWEQHRTFYDLQTHTTWIGDFFRQLQEWSRVLKRRVTYMTTTLGGICVQMVLACSLHIAKLLSALRVQLHKDLTIVRSGRQVTYMILHSYIIRLIRKIGHQK